MQNTNAHRALNCGQSIWLDNISRAMFTDGTLKRMIEQGLRGMTSNPTIFEKSIGGGTEYDDQINAALQTGESDFQIYDELTVTDIQKAADMFLPVYRESAGRDGYVSLETNPELAYDSMETVKEVQRLKARVDRPNVMFKVPATAEGFPAIERLTAEGVNINITLIFSLEQYEKTARAFIRGLQSLDKRGGEPGRIGSVASVFVSRIDTLADTRIEARLDAEADPQRKQRLRALKGRIALANSGLIYARFREIFSGQDFLELSKNGAGLQRVLWGSTSTKNPQYDDLKYVDNLIGRNTVNTMPTQTFHAFLDHGKPIETLTGEKSEAKKVVKELADCGISYDNICNTLLREGVDKFSNSFKSLLNTIHQKRASL